MTARAKAAPGGAAHEPLFFEPGDETVLRLFDAVERDAFRQAVIGSHDILGQPATALRTELSIKIRERLITSLLAYYERMHVAADGFRSPEFGSANRFMMELERVADVLKFEAAMTCDDTLRLSSNVDFAWAEFVADALSHRMLPAAYRGIKAESARPVAAKLGAKAMKTKAEMTRHKVGEAHSKLPLSQRGRSAAAVIGSKLNLTPETVRTHLKALGLTLKTE